jgi:hypothetical protein
MFELVSCAEDVGVLSMVQVLQSVGRVLDVGVLGMVLGCGCSMAVVAISMLHAMSSEDKVT